MMSHSRVRRLGLLVIALSLAWLLLLRGYADYLARPAPDRALALNSGQPVALMLSAERALSEGRLDQAQALSMAALSAQPFEGTALRILGAVAELRGDRSRAMALMQKAVATTPRESAAQFWLAINALADKDIDAALQRLDRLLRFEPQVQKQVFPILSVIAVNPIGAGPISRYLASNAPWRPEFVARLISAAESSAALSRLFRAIQAAGGTIAQTELDLFASRLFARQEWPRLRRLLSDMDPGGHSLLRDGGFDGKGRGPFLGWTIRRVGGVDILPAAAVQGENRALRIVFLDRRVPFRHVSQSLLLEPGSYKLNGRARSIDLRTALGLNWVLGCVESGAVIAQSERLLGTHDWHSFEVGFVVPDEKCGGQVLTLVLAARIAAEQQAVGEAWFDDLAITRNPAGAVGGSPGAR